MLRVELDRLAIDASTFPGKRALLRKSRRAQKAADEGERSRDCQSAQEAGNDHKKSSNHGFVRRCSV